MASEVSICNNALIKMGEETILSLEDDTKRARLCKALYPELRDSVLRDHLWNFAVKRVTLAPLATGPEFGFDYQFQLPSDFIRLVQIGDEKYIREDYLYKIEGNNILANDDTLQLIYVSRIEDPATMDVLFREALAARLGMELAKALADNDNLSARLRDLYYQKITEARTVDAQDDYAPVVTAEKWLQKRLQ